MGNNALGVRTASETMRTTIAANVTNAFVAIGTPLTNTSRVLKFDNFTDTIIAFSDDGVNTKFELYAYSSFALDEDANKSNISMSYGYAAGTQFYIKYVGSAPTVNSVNVSTWYASNPDNT